MRNRLKRLAELTLYSVVCFLYYRISIDEKLVFFDSCGGRGLSSDVLRIVQALSTREYGFFKMAIHVDKSKLAQAERLLEVYGLDNLKLVTRGWASLLLMERAKYIVLDSSVMQGYIKKDGQVVLGFWRETSLSLAGFQKEKAVDVDAQNLFLNSDFCVFSSRIVSEEVLRLHMVKNAMSGKVLLTGYPRNIVFFDDGCRERLRFEFGLQDKSVLVYAPMWKESVGGSATLRELVGSMSTLLSKIDARLDDGQVLYPKLHPSISSEIDYSQLAHTRPYPIKYDETDVLNIADCLITDDFNMCMDFSNTGRKIILFSCESELAVGSASYVDSDNLPFPVVRDVDDLAAEILSEKRYSDTEFLRRFCTYDSKDAVKDLCRHVFAGEKRCQEVSFDNGKENVLIMGGGLAKNGITSSLLNLLSNMDLRQRNYYVSYRKWELDCFPERLDAVPEGVSLLPLAIRKRLTLREHAVYRRFLRGKYKDGELPKVLQRAFKREVDRCFHGVDFSSAVQFDGYNNDSMLLFSFIESAKRSVFVHNDMRREIVEKKNQNAAVLGYVYRHYDAVAVVSEDLVEPTTDIGGSVSNTVVVHNVLDYRSVRSRAVAPIELQGDTVVVCSNPGGIECVLHSRGRKIISIGRFSPEKGHARLLRAFNEYHSAYPEDHLIIVGGSGTLFEDTVRLVSALSCKDNVTLIKSMANPMPILSKCDLLVISSYYEGLPMVIGEADALNVPVLATDVVALRGFMVEHGGCLVYSSEEGILEGLLRFARQGLPVLGIDFDSHNCNAVAAFDSLLRS
ncbi:CDP-glycerol glycerophosphotransferase family protein [Eggerthella lenta]|nr:CDP-glycerol glycerophosphotransferase family protein [Eggerthella lenta]